MSRARETELSEAMPFIVFLGCDGSGKSTVISSVSERLKQADQRVLLAHWRPRPIQKKMSTEALVNAEDPHGKRAYGPLASFAKLCWIWLNWWAGWFGGMRRAARQGFLIFDRFHEDMQVDPCRYRYGGPLWMCRVSCWLMPRPEMIIYLDAPVEVLLSRKQEVGADSLERAREGYLKLCEKHSRYYVVDASRPVEEVVDVVFRIVNQ